MASISIVEQLARVLGAVCCMLGVLSCRVQFSYDRPAFQGRRRGVAAPTKREHDDREKRVKDENEEWEGDLQEVEWKGKGEGALSLSSCEEL